MQSFRSSASFQGGDGLDLSLTGSQLSVSRRPSSASPAKPIARSISVITENKAKKNAPEDSGQGGSQAINNLRRSNSTTQVNHGMGSLLSTEHPEDFLALFGSTSNGRRKMASLSKVSPERKGTWNILVGPAILVKEEFRVNGGPVPGASLSLGIPLAYPFGFASVVSTFINMDDKAVIGEDATWGADSLSITFPVKYYK